MSNRFVIPVVVAATALFSCDLGAAGFFPLGDLTGGIVDSQALGISGDGSTVVGQGSSASGTEAFVWTSGGGMVGLGFVPGGESPSFAVAASADGTTVVGQSAIAESTEAFVWTSGGSTVGLGFLTGGALPSDAIAVSADGLTIVGGSASATGSEAYYWTTGTGMVSLGDLASGSVSSVAIGVSADGATIVGRGQSGSGSEAFSWTSGGGIVGLGYLPGGSSYSQANAISADATTIVGTSLESTFEFEAFRSVNGGSLQSLGTLGSGSSEALAVSADGAAIVGTSQIALVDNAFVWTNAAGMQTVAALAASEGIAIPPGWDLQRAYGISGDGGSIVGSGVNQNDNEAWMITLSDTDADGRPDYIDNCPNEPNGPANNPGGGAPQQDTDGDGLGDACDLSITTTSLPSARAGKNYSQQLTALGGTIPYTWTVTQGNLDQSGLSVSSDGLISGEVQSSFLLAFTVQVMDSMGDTATRDLTIRVTVPNCMSCHSASADAGPRPATGD